MSLSQMRRPPFFILYLRVRQKLKKWVWHQRKKYLWPDSNKYNNFKTLKSYLKWLKKGGISLILKFSDLKESKPQVSKMPIFQALLKKETLSSLATNLTKAALPTEGSASRISWKIRKQIHSLIKRNLMKKLIWNWGLIW